MTDQMEKKLRARFFTKIQDQIKNPDHQDFWLRKEKMYSKRDQFSIISIETTYNNDGIPEKEKGAEDTETTDYELRLDERCPMFIALG